jgi:hypothetical protein
LAERCKVDSFENRSAIKSQLAIFMKEAEELSEELTKDSSPSEVKDWFSRTAEWENNVSVWAKANLGDAAEAKVSNKVGYNYKVGQTRSLRITEEDLVLSIE